MGANASEQRQKAILILEDQDRVREAWVQAIQKALPEAYVFGAAGVEGAWAAIRRAEQRGCTIVLVLVDQVLDGDRQAGARFLEEFRRTHPDAQRMMFSGQSQRDEIQAFLDRSLIHHFQSKSVFADEVELTDTFLEKVKEMISGRSRGNVSDPDFEQRIKEQLGKGFREELSKWIKALPDGEDTEIRSLSGRAMRAGDILKDPDMIASLQEGYLAGTLHALLSR